MRKMKAVMYYKPQDIRYEEVSIPALEEGEVLVKVEAALTCGTDVKTFRRGHPVLIKKTPSGFGHEFAGVVHKVGKNVTKFKVGDRVITDTNMKGKIIDCTQKGYLFHDKVIRYAKVVVAE